MKTNILTIVSAFLSIATVAHALPAFPGAEGWGSDTPGGRGGRTIQVTNLNDSGPGSFREACESAGPRIVVFTVGGTITLQSEIRIADPFITIAGQTAPGGGICLRNAPLRVVTHDVVIRFLRVRVGPSTLYEPGKLDTVWVGGDTAHDVVIDHCSFSWSLDEVASAVSGASRVTYSWCLISEGLRDPFAKPGEPRERNHAYAIMLGSNPNHVSFHHNFVSNCDHRNPRVQGGRHQIVNNVFYNWGYLTGTFSRDPEVNFIGNFYKPGPNSEIQPPIVERESSMGRIYVRGNIAPTRPNNTLPEWDGVVNAPAETHQANEPFPAPDLRTTDAWRAYWDVTTAAGATLPKRDAVDNRLIREVMTGTGSVIDHPDEVGGYPDLAGATPPLDTDRDGMPDTWEDKMGLDSMDPDDASGANPDGYTRIEHYLNTLAESAPVFDAESFPYPLTMANSTMAIPDPPPAFELHGERVLPIIVSGVPKSFADNPWPELEEHGINGLIVDHTPTKPELDRAAEHGGHLLYNAGNRMVIVFGDEPAMYAWADDIKALEAVKDHPALWGILGPVNLTARWATSQSTKWNVDADLPIFAWPSEAQSDHFKVIDGIRSGFRMLEKKVHHEIPVWTPLGDRIHEREVIELTHLPTTDYLGVEVTAHDPASGFERIKTLRQIRPDVPIAAHLQLMQSGIPFVFPGDVKRDDIALSMAVGAWLSGARAIIWDDTGFPDEDDSVWQAVVYASNLIREVNRSDALVTASLAPFESLNEGLIAGGCSSGPDTQRLIAVNTTRDPMSQAAIDLNGCWSGFNGTDIVNCENVKTDKEFLELSLRPWESAIVIRGVQVVPCGP